MTYMRRFYLKLSVFEFDPVELLFTCIYHALKVEEVSIDLEAFCTKINQPNLCKPESNNSSLNMGLEVLALEVLLVRGLKF